MNPNILKLFTPTICVIVKKTYDLKLSILLLLKSILCHNTAIATAENKQVYSIGFCLRPGEIYTFSNQS